jgi:integrase
MAYYAIHHRPHRTLTEVEQAKVLKVTGEHARGFRDHVLFALALGTGLREHEALALDVGDITEDGSTVKRRITLRVFKRCTKRPAPQEIFLPDSLHYKLGRLLAWKKRRGESLAPDAPLLSRARATVSRCVWRGLHSAAGNSVLAWTGSTASTRCATPRAPISIARRVTSAWSSASRAT